MNISLETSLKLGQTLSPQMIQSLKLLQYNNLQLEQVIRKELQENPILEESAGEETADEVEDPLTVDSDTPLTVETREEGDGASGDKEEESASQENSVDDVDWDEYYASDGTDLSHWKDDEKEGDLYDKVQINSLSLEEHLIRQLHEKKLTERQIEIGDMIIGNLNDKGYLTQEPSAIADKLEVPLKEVEEVRHLILRFDPAGVAAVDLRENLLTQIYNKGLSQSLMGRIVADHFELLKKYQIPEIARRLDAPVLEVQTAIREIGHLDPNPGMLIGMARAQIIIPDVIVTKQENGEFLVSLNDGNVPNIKISRSYLRLLKTERRKNQDVKKYVSEKLNAANWLIRSIEQRKVTMVKVMTAIVEKQRLWFEKGPPNLRPLILQEVADRISMHVSTVCRVTNEKYAQTPFGIFELKYFFSTGLRSDDGENQSSTAICALIRNIIESEDKHKPLSDQKVTDLLKKQGTNVARRTIAKYREEMGILPAKMRRSY